MEVSAMSSSRFTQRMLATPNTPTRISSSSYSLKRTLKNSLSVKASLSNSNNLSAPFVGGIHNNGGGSRGGSGSGRRGVITRVNPYTRGNDWEQVPPDVASYLYKNRIVYLGMPLVPSVTELILAEFLYLQYDDAEKPIYLYVNSTGTTKNGEKLGYESEAFAIYDVMRYVKPPVYTLCLGNAWGEAALLLAAGAKGNRYALPSSSIMMKEPTGRFQGQATDIESARKDVNSIKKELVNLLAAHTGKAPEQIEQDMSRPKYFTPTEAIEYGLIDKVLDNKRATESGVISNLRKARLI